MKLKRLLALALFAWALSIGVCSAQSVSVTATAGAGGPYTTLKAAFDAINAGTFTGSITITVGQNTTETATAALNASGTGSANYTRVRIVPASTGGPYTISGNLNNNGLVHLNGADNVTIDGNVGGARHLIFRNTNIGGGVLNFASAVLFSNGATVDSLVNCSLQVNTVASNGAAIVFYANSNAAPTDNQDIVVSSCVLSESTSRPVRLIATHRLDNTITRISNRIKILNTHIYNWQFASSGAQSIRIETAANNWTIDGCHFYAPITRYYTSTSNGINYCIRVTTGNNYKITNNKFGGSGRDASNNITGTYTVNASTADGNYRTLFIECSANTFLPTDSIYIANNEFGNISSTNASASPGQQNVRFLALSGSVKYVVYNNYVHDILHTSMATATQMGFNSAVDCFNYFGSNTASSMTYNRIENVSLDFPVGTETQEGRFNGFRFDHTFGTITVANNSVRNITNNSQNVIAVIRGFNVNNNGGTVILSRNTVSNITSPSAHLIGMRVSGTGEVRSSRNRFSNLSNTSTLGSSLVTGIQDAGTGNSSYNTDTISALTQTGTGAFLSQKGFEMFGAGTDTISNCLITGLSSSGTYVGLDGSVVGLSINLSSGGSLLVSQNTLYNLAATSTDDQAINVAAMVVGVLNNSTTVNISRNRIYAIKNAAAGITVPNSACGIILRAPAGTVDISNNMIALGYGETTPTVFAGIWTNLNGAAIPVVRHNTVTIGGSSATVTPSFAYIRGNNTLAGVTTSVQLVNNIFQNERTGALPVHYAIANQITSVGWTANPPCGSLLPNYNAYYANSDAEIGFWLTAATTSFADWQTQSGADVNSIDVLNTYPNTAMTFTAASTADLHTPNTELRGNAKGLQLSFNEDYDGTIFRRGPDIGADEVNNVLTYTGGTGYWHDPTTWNSGVGVPTHADSVIVPAAAVVTVASGNPGACYQLNINNGGTLVLEDGALLEQCWLHNGTNHLGFIQNNGTINSGAATIALAGQWEDNASYLDNNEGTVQLNLDAPTTQPACMQTWIQSFNDDADTSPLIGTAETEFYNLTLLNAGKVTVTGPDYITIGDATLGTGTLNIVNADGWLRWDGKDLYLAGTIDGPGTLYGSSTSDLYIRGNGDMNAGMTIGTLNWRSNAQVVNLLDLDRNGVATLGRTQSNGLLVMQVQGNFNATQGELSIGVDNTLQLYGYVNTTGGTITGSDSYTTYLHLLGTANDNMGTIVMTTTTIGTQTLSDLIINRGTSDAASATLATDVLVTRALGLNSGRLITGSNEIFVTTNVTSAVSGHSAASFVEGNLRRAVGAFGTMSYDFPLGVQGRYNLLNMTMGTVLAPTNEVLGTFISGNASASGWDPNPLIEAGYLYDCVSEGGYWTLEPYEDGVFTQPASGSYDITVYPTGIDCATPKTRYTLGKRTVAADPWSFAGSTAGSTGLSPATRSGYTSFSDLAIIGAEELPLPVSSLHLGATLQGNDALLTWTTQDELNTATFALEYSYEGSAYQPIHQRTAAGYTQGITTYTHRHAALPAGLHNYRVRLTDMDGYTTQSNTASVMLGTDGAAFALLTPYYQHGLQLPVFVPTEGSVQVRVLSLLGQQLHSGNYSTGAGTHTIALPQLQLAQGAYIVQVSYLGTTLSQRVWVR